MTLTQQKTLKKKKAEKSLSYKDYERRKEKDRKKAKEQGQEDR